ncbi:hypothetical protein [Polaribacter aquimarinus]|uniref:Uncharacterized protein n=1 Tax=Polaribacter aquimarinus TaxID=2100726 RepID=A0A2U2J6W1_9FLAO|nr:hypothetical protein [Polaribacter aquimarinus]PWG04042.1 hypothetical protein DIS07_14725 [Polaribacter aquimarinus]
MKKLKFIVLFYSMFILINNIYSQDTKEYYYTDIQTFDEENNKMELDDKMKSMLGKHFFITELENSLILSPDRNYKEGKDIYLKKENNISSRIYYQKNNRTNAKLTINLSMFSNTILFEITHKFSKIKKILVKAKEI